MADRPENPEKDTQWRAAGDRIQTLLDSCAASGAAAYERAQQLVREVVGLYGAGLERIVRAGDAGLAERLAADDLVASLLLVHGLHPHDVHRRVSDALDRVRPYLGSHGGDVDLLEIVAGEGPGENTVRLAFRGSCKSCPSSAVTLELAVQDAVRAAAPEVTSIEVVTAPTEKVTGVIPAESLMAHVKSNGHAAGWHAVPEVGDLAPGEVAGFLVSGTPLLVCRVGDLPLAYRDHCPVCDDSLAGALLRDALLGCPRCGTQFDAVHAGAGPGGAHLEPLPLLLRDGVPSVALDEPMGARA
ncbi:NifU family protein [Mycobacterium terramassiliense]|uniref:Fe-S cluster biogenesis protein NfuA n=1 Tax=Mycobacterium terramassiliense TaxID=1841859 RepID=A0A2U3N7Q2_9MYCO|nr:NifU family protein [Mycobacterium terramassiliense]SPM27548.1 Fe-S cluster biogenesis protein NfuA [Mycobacterium terramassiliense]